MKFTKRITSMLLIFVFAFTSMCMVAPAADFSDVASEYVHYEAITALVDQGIINGYEDGTFKPENTITRAEFSKLLAVSSAPSGYKFNATTTTFPDIADMNAEHGWAVPYISYAVSTKAINGYTDGTFQAGNPVTYGEAIKMIVCTLGYGPVVDTKLTPWYQGYLNIANQIGLTKNAAALGETPANRGIVAHLIYNMLDCPVLVQTGIDINGNPTYSQGGTQQEEQDDSQTAEGIVMGVTDHSLDGTAIAKNSIQIGSETFMLGGGLSVETVKSYIGHRVEYSYTNSGSKNVVVRITRLSGYNTSVTIEPWQIVDIKPTYIEYFADETAELKNEVTKVTYTSKPYVIYNGVPVKPALIGGDFDVTSYFDIETGKITLLSNDLNDKSAELVIVESYKTYFVNQPVFQDGVLTIYDKNQTYTSLPSLTIDEDDVASVTRVSSKGGSQTSATLSAVSDKHIVSVAVPYGTKEGTKVIISSAYVTGDVNELSSDYEYIKIGSAEYELSPYYTSLKANDEFVSNNPGFVFSNRDNAKFYLDYLGRIAYVEKNETSDPYGLIVAYTDGSGIDSAKSIMLLGAESNSPQPRVLDSKVRVIVGTETYEGDAAAINAIKSAATISAGTSVAVPVRYKKPSGNVIKSFEILTAEHAKGSYTYSKSGSSFTASGKTFNAASSGTNKTTIFAVPVAEDYDKYDSYKKSSLSTLFTDKESFEVAAYDLVGTTARLLVCYLKTDQTASAEIVSATPVYMIESITNTTNNGQTVNKITYRPITAAYDSDLLSDFTSEKASAIVKDKSLTSGDLIKFVKENNEITDIKTVFIGGNKLTAETAGRTIVGSDGAIHHIIRDGNYTNDNYYQVVYGTINTFDAEGKNMSILYDPEANSALDNDVTGASFTLSDSVKYYKYDAGRNSSKFVQASPGLIVKYNDKPKDAVATKVVAVYMNGSVVGIYVLDN